MAPSKVYDEYGSMNGDYYVIVMEENYLYLTGRTDVKFKDLPFTNESLKKNGSLPLDLRKGLREDVEEYGLDCTMPNDPDFIDGTAERPAPTNKPSTGSEYFTPEEMEEMNKAPVEPEIPTVPTESAAPIEGLQYADVTPDAWYYEAVTAMSEGGLFKGYDDGLFHPNDNITYGQWAMLMSRIAVDNYSYEMKSGDHWAREAFSRASRDSLCELPNAACGETLDSLYNRGQAIDSAYCLAHYDKSGLEGRLAARYTGKTWTFDDIPDGELVQQSYAWYSGEGDWFDHSTGRWNDTWVLGAYNLGITHGVDAIGTCNPSAPITRAEVAQLLYNMGVTHEKMCDLRSGGIGF
jgi:S-layer homology domain.